MKFNQKAVENLGRMCMDASKLAFGSLVLGTILKGDVERAYVIIAGSIAALLLAAIGIYLASK
jgi:hypothetical protein